MIEIPLAKPVKVNLLYEQIAAAFPDWVIQDAKEYPFLFRVDTVTLDDGTSAHLLYVPDDANLPAVQAVIDAHDPAQETQAEKLQTAITTQAKSAVGMSVNTLTSTQVRALLAILLHKAGAIDPQTMEIRPLAQWAR